MNCKNCGASVSLDVSFCSQCGHKIDNSKKKFNYKKTFKILLGCLILLILVIILFFIIKPSRSEVLNSLTKNDYYKFTINNIDYYLGDKVSNLKTNELYYDNNFSDIIYGDSISIRTFFNLNNQEQFLAALYCSSKSSCTHEDSTIVKANFYKNSNVIVNDFIKYGVTYQEILEKYGKEDGYFYQDEEMLVWTFGDKKVGEPYYALKFTDSIFSGKQIAEIRIGVWWYEGEYEHTVLKNVNKKVETK